MNIKILRQIEADLRVPRATFKRRDFNMNLWGGVPSSSVGDNACDTAVCIGGDALLLAGCELKYSKTVGDYVFLRPGKTLRDYAKEYTRDARLKEAGEVAPLSKTIVDNENREARRILGLNEVQAMKLFSVSSWPQRYAEVYNEAVKNGDSKGVRLAGADRIAHFVATEGAE